MFSLRKLLLVLVFWSLIIGYVLNTYYNIFYQNDTNNLVKTIKKINKQGQKNIEREKKIGLNDFERKLDNLYLWNWKISEVLLTYSWTTVFTWNKYKWASMSWYWYFVDISNNNVTLNITYKKNLWVKNPVILWSLQLNWNSSNHKLAGFDWKNYYLIFNNNTKLPQKLLDASPTRYKDLWKKKIYNEDTGERDVEAKILKLKFQN